MKTLQTVLTILTQPNCYMATIDLKYAFCSIKTDSGDTRFLKFLCSSKFFKLLALPNGLSPDPRKFTKLTNSTLAMLRYTAATYIDDIIAIKALKMVSFLREKQ